jgi:glycosyltransferase involved in cell wall biosynthesis
MMRPAVQIWSNAPNAATGYGTQTAVLADWLLANEFEVSISANFGAQTQPQEMPLPSGRPVLVYPQGYDGYSQDVIYGHYRHFKESVKKRTLLLTLYDVWVLKADKLPEVDRIVAWTPIDHTPVPPEVFRFSQRENVLPVAMSRFGQDQLTRLGVEAEFIPHTVSPEFRRRKGGGEMIGADDSKFVVMMNAANKGVHPTRKAWSENLLALSVFAADKPDVYIYLHTEARCPAGIDVNALVKSVGLQDKVRFPDQYAYRMGLFTTEMLARMYTRADVLLAVSLGEGFGIPTVEAQACGTRVIGSRATATPELVSEDGWLVDGQPEWDPAQHSFWHRPHVHSIVKALNEAYESKRGESRKAILKADEFAEGKWLPKWGELLEQA